jgi:iron transport multicopper oxidase
MIVTLGDSLIVNVKNNLNVPTALHAHGLYQNKTNFMDGAFGITECGILPGESFTYNFTIAQTGTYWIHGHFMGQYVDGLRAPLILLDPKEPAKYDSEYIVSLAGSWL